MPIVLHVQAFRDNYIWLIRATSGPSVAIVDPGDAEPVLAALARERLTPVAILCTHHHGDHVGGVAGIARSHPVPVYGPPGVPGVTHAVGEGDRVTLPPLALTLRVLAIPGHTLDHLAFVGEELLFCGDTLFSAGCGRLFEGSASQLHGSLERLKALPDDTAVYCGHEYTLANLRFALTVDPTHAPALAWRDEAAARLARGEPSLPSTIGREKQFNPFLRVGTPTVRAALERHTGKRPSDDVAAFAALRQWKDEFHG